MSTYELPVIYFCLVIKAWIKLYDQMRMGTLILIHIVRARKLFYDDVISSQQAALF